MTTALLCLSLLAAPALPRGVDAGSPSAEPSLDMLAAFSALPTSFESELNPLTEAKIALGRMLFFEPRLSKNHDLSCNSCHDLARYGVDGKAFSTGHKQQVGDRNSPTVYNAGGHVAQFWDGRAATVEEQAKGPMMNPVEMASSGEDQIVKTLKSIPGYVQAFEKAFPKDEDPVTLDNAAKAIGAFERKLVTPSRFDRYLKGDKSALTPKEKQGLSRFVSTGCTACHAGVGLGGQTYMKLGLVEAWPDRKDLGRYKVTQQESDKMVFRVPTLRNVEKTGPYFHTGAVKSLDEAVRLMARHQLGKALSPEETSDIVAFLGSLTGEIPKAYVKPPPLPESSASTPKPDPS